jgi:uncharacterized protein UPF0547
MMKLAASLTLLLALGLGGAWFSEFRDASSDWMFPRLAQQHSDNAEKYGVGAVITLIASIVIFAKSGKPTATDLSRKCPDCAETIKMEAIVCRFCGHKFQPVGGQGAVQQAKSE